MDSQDIEAFAADAYRRGKSALDIGLAVVEVLAEETLGLDCGNPAVKQLARRVVGGLLDAGWTMPNVGPDRKND
jgi:hypothetical protein